MRHSACDHFYLAFYNLYAVKNVTQSDEDDQHSEVKGVHRENVYDRQCYR